MLRSWPTLRGARRRPPDLQPSSFPSVRPFRVGQCRRRSGAPQFSIRSLPLLSPVGRCPVGLDAPERPLRKGRSFYVLLARPFGGNPKKPQLHYHHVFPYWQTSMEKFRLIIPRNLQIAVFGKVKPHVILIR